MKYTFKCPACGQPVEVEAENDDEAVDKLMAAGDVHQKEVHAEMPPMPQDQMRNMVREQMTKEQSQAA
ncbi:MAG: hypothetical protein AAB639_00335 [Patescibacteria group bacterium]